MSYLPLGVISSGAPSLIKLVLPASKLVDQASSVLVLQLENQGAVFFGKVQINPSPAHQPVITVDPKKVLIGGDHYNKCIANAAAIFELFKSNNIPEQREDQLVRFNPQKLSWLMFFDKTGKIIDSEYLDYASKWEKEEIYYKL
jgi:hypothetical protein